MPLEPTLLLLIRCLLRALEARGFVGSYSDVRAPKPDVAQWALVLTLGMRPSWPMDLTTAIRRLLQQRQTISVPSGTSIL
ncbi:hypothetical protein C8F04DRAFT_1260873 [Mycena alexandri]|uniref:Secreted protein n=1 Tax=Mycena alexandri TaxID=1745969 RepID=A0AAD6X2U7_9AGAR|nr:hypothetical protein C8F04DRAFT_1260873 [Mycena alexandri]